MMKKRNFIQLKGIGDMWFRFDIAKNVQWNHNGKGASQLKYPVIITMYDRSTQKVVARDISSISDISNKINKYSEEGLLWYDESMVEAVAGSISAIYGLVSEGEISPSVVAYNKEGWIADDMVAYGDRVFVCSRQGKNKFKPSIKKKEMNPFSNIAELEKKEESTVACKNKQLDDQWEIPYNTAIPNIKHYINGFCYGQGKWKPQDYCFEAEFEKDALQYFKNKPKAQIIYASMLNSLIYQALHFTHKTQRDELTILEVCGAKSTGKSSFTKSFATCVFGCDNSNTEFRTPFSSEAAFDKFRKERGIKSTVCDDNSSKMQTSQQVAQWVFQMGKGISRDNMRTAAENIYSQLVLSSEKKDSLARILAADNRMKTEGQKYRFISLEMSRKDFCFPSDDFGEMRKLFLDQSTWILKVLECLAVNGWTMSKIADLFEVYTDVIKMPFDAINSAQRVQLDKERWSPKVAVYAVSAEILKATFAMSGTKPAIVDNVFDINKVIAEIVKSVYKTERILNKEMNAQQLARKFLYYVSEHSEFVANSPAEYDPQLHWACIGSANSNSPTMDMNRIWVPSEKIYSLIEAIKEDLSPEFVLETERNKNAKDYQILGELSQMRFDDDLEYGDTIIEAASKKLAQRKTVGLEKRKIVDKYVVVFNIQTLLMRLLNDLAEE